MMEFLLAQAAPHPSFWMPPQASTKAAGVDWLFNFILYVCLFFFVLIAVLMFYFMIRYRRRTPYDKVASVTHNTPLEVAWSVLPSFVLVLMFWWGFDGFMYARTVPANPYEVKVKAQKWSWLFTYPNGSESDNLHVPVNRPIRLVMSSEDVIHSLFVPAFRVKRDVVPGRYSELWFQATHTGEYDLYCTEYCGTSHSDMRGTVFVYDAKDFEHWLETNDPIKQLTPEQYQEYRANYDDFVTKYAADPVVAPVIPKLLKPAEMGRKLYTKKGCSSCHSVDGGANTGPTWKEMYAHEVALSDGSKVMADENYLRESILNPNAKIVAGFRPGQMPVVSMTDREIDLLIEYMKTLK